MKYNEFLKSGNYLISEVKTLAENGYSKYWFSADTMNQMAIVVLNPCRPAGSQPVV